MTSRDVTARSSSAPRGPRDDRSKRCDALVQRQSPVLVFFPISFYFFIEKIYRVPSDPSPIDVIPSYQRKDQIVYNTR